MFIHPLQAQPHRFSPSIGNAGNISTRWVQSPPKANILQFGASTPEEPAKKKISRSQLAWLGGGSLLALVGAFGKQLGIHETLNTIGLWTGLLIAAHTVPVFISHYIAVKFGAKRGIQKFVGSIKSYEDLRKLVCDTIGPKLDNKEVTITQVGPDKFIVEKVKPAEKAPENTAPTPQASTQPKEPQS